MPKSFSLAFITGASSGIGESLAYLLADKGINVILHGRNQDNLNKIQQDLQAKVHVEILCADLVNPSERQKVVELIQTKKPDLMLNNAGFGFYGPALSFQIKEELGILEVNATAVLEFTLHTAQMMIASGIKGVILNVSSSAGEIPITPGFAVYSASKACVNHFSQSLDRELKKSGVRVLAAAPGFVKTNFGKRAGGQKNTLIKNLTMSSEFAAQQIWKQIEQEIPLRVFDWKTRFLVRCANLFPKSWVAIISQRFNQIR